MGSWGHNKRVAAPGTSDVQCLCSVCLGPCPEVPSPPQGGRQGCPTLTGCLVSAWHQNQGSISWTNVFCVLTDHLRAICTWLHNARWQGGGMWVGGGSGEVWVGKSCWRFIFLIMLCLGLILKFVLIPWAHSSLGTGWASGRLVGFSFIWDRHTRVTQVGCSATGLDRGAQVSLPGWPPLSSLEEDGREPPHCPWLALPNGFSRWATQLFLLFCSKTILDMVNNMQLPN